MSGQLKYRNRGLNIWKQRNDICNQELETANMQILKRTFVELTSGP